MATVETPVAARNSTAGVGAGAGAAFILAPEISKPPVRPLCSVAARQFDHLTALAFDADAGDTIAFALQ